MLWAAFGHNRWTGLVPLDGDPDAPRGGVTSKVIVELYRAFLPEIMVQGGEFMQEGAHRGHIVRDMLREIRKLCSVFSWISILYD